MEEEQDPLFSILKEENFKETKILVPPRDAAFFTGQTDQSFQWVQKYAPSGGYVWIAMDNPPPVTYMPPSAEIMYQVQQKKKNGRRKKRLFKPAKPSLTAMGDYTHLIRGMFFGIALPLVSSILVFALEMTQLARLGVTFATADLFLWAAAIMLSFQRHLDLHRQLSYVGLGICIVLVLISLGIFCFCFRLWRTFEASHRKHCGSAAILDHISLNSRVGHKPEFWLSFIISVLLPVIGPILSMAWNRSLYSRYGAALGMAWNITLLGAFCVWIPKVGFEAANPFLILGLILLQSVFVYFNRTIISTKEALRRKLNNQVDLKTLSFDDEPPETVQTPIISPPIIPMY